MEKSARRRAAASARKFLDFVCIAKLTFRIPDVAIVGAVYDCPGFRNETLWAVTDRPYKRTTLAMIRDFTGETVLITGGTMSIVEQSGPAESHVWETGKAYWLPANSPETMHADVNKGEKPIEVMVVELKHEM